MAGEGMDSPEVTPEEGQLSQTPSILNRLRQQRERIGEVRTTRLPIPGYNGELIAEYRLLEWSQLRQVIRRMEKSKASDARELLAQVDVIAQACVGIYFKHPDAPDDELVPLYSDRVTRYDRNLAEALGFPDRAETARMVVLETFRNDIAVATHHSQLMDWMQGNTEEANDEFLGESPGPTS